MSVTSTHSLSLSMKYVAYPSTRDINKYMSNFYIMDIIRYMYLVENLQWDSSLILFANIILTPQYSHSKTKYSFLGNNRINLKYAKQC